jgi:hypothetical protein
MLENVTRLWLIVRLVMTRGHWSADWAATLTYRTLRVVMLIYFWLWHRFDHSVLIVIPLKLGAQSAKVHWKRPAGRGGRPRNLVFEMSTGARFISRRASKYS